MKLRVNWRPVLIVFVLIVGANGIIEALPRSKETAGDLLIDGGLIALVVAVSLGLAWMRMRRGRGLRAAAGEAVDRDG